MKNLGAMMKQAQKMQERMAEVQNELKDLEILGSAGGDMVTVTMDGQSNVKAIKIDPSLVDPDEIDMLEDLIVAATNDAHHKVEATSKERMSEVTGGLNIPGMKLPF